jgi:putative ABC transport system permease protein
MIYIAWRMLVGDRTKYVSLVAGIAFAVLLITQQSSIFAGIMSRTFSTITDVPAAKVWVMDPGVQYPDDIKPMKDGDLSRVRDVEGVDWAVPLFKSTGRARTRNGEFQTVFVIGLDAATLIGGPSRMVTGKLTDVWEPDSVIVDDAGALRLGGVQIGDVLELNDRRARIVGICRIERTFVSFPVLYTTYDRGVAYVPGDRRAMSFVLAAPKPGVSDEDCAARITEQTGLGAFTSQQFARRTLGYYFKNTGIAINFGTTVLLGFLVGLAVATQTLYTFTVENLRQFGALKAMGATNGTLVRMVLFQAIVAGLLGYGFGVGLTAVFGHLTRNSTQLAFRFLPEALVGSFVVLLVLVMLASILSLRRVVKLEPGIVFRA